MKKTILGSLGIVIIWSVIFTSCGNLSKENTTLITTEFKVYGNCGMCEETIEGSLIYVDGIHNADWDKKTKLISISYDSKKLNEDELKSKIAAVGYDTDLKRASEDDYNSLPVCCQYDRP